MRPKTKDDAQKLTLTLSGPARDILMREALRRGVSRTQVVEDLTFEFANRNSGIVAEGNTVPQPHSVGGVSNVIKPFAGGCDAPTRYATAAEEKRQARSSK
jgi:hypothetical protein